MIRTLHQIHDVLQPICLVGSNSGFILKSINKTPVHFQIVEGLRM
jgi:hypothetical protein